MNILRPLLILITLFIYSYGFSQKDAIDLAIDKMRAKHPVPEISKEQMRIDFDQLIKIIKNNDAQLLARRKVTGIDIIEEINELKKEIDTISNLDNFIVLIYRAIRLTQDPHASNGYDVYYYHYTYYKKDCKRLGLKDTEFSYNFKYQDIIYDNFNFALGFIYKNKKYYLKSDLNIYSNNDSILINKGSELIGLNDLLIDSFISKYRSYQEGLRWDFSNNSFYVTELSKPTNLNITSITINDKNGVSNKIECDSFLFMQNEFMPRIYGKPQVHFFSEDSILYIRCPLMSVYRSKYSILR